MRSFYVAAEYGAGSVWEDDWDGVRDLNPTPSSLGATAELQAAFDAWELELERTLDPHYPPDGGFATTSELVAFNLVGQRLAERLQTELGPETVVRYLPLAALLR